MKKYFTIYLLVISKILMYAQPTEILDRTWYLHKLVIDQTEHFPPSNTEAQPNQITVMLKTNDLLATSGCNWLGDEIIYDPNELKFWSYNGYWEISLAECDLYENQLFEGLYFYNFWSIEYMEIPNPFAYEILTDQPNHTLIITNDLGYKAYYGLEQLNTNDVVTDQKPVQIAWQNHVLTILNSDNVIAKTVWIFDINGREMMKFKPINRSNFYTHNLPKGIYFIQIEDQLGRIHHFKKQN